MIKRPLIWILSAYLIGLILAWYHCMIWIVCMIAILISLIIYVFMFHTKFKVINRKDSFLWSLSLLILLGYGAMYSQCKEPELSKCFEQEVTCKLSGEISMIVDKSWGRAIYVKNNEITLVDGKPFLCENLIVYTADSTELRIGNRIEVSGKLQKFAQATNPGQFNEFLYYQTQNIDYKISADQIKLINSNYSMFHHLLRSSKQKLIMVYDKLLPEKEAGALITMLLGDKYLLDEEIKQLYQENGISHILAISGLHISLIGMTIFQLLKRLKMPLTLAIFLSIFFIYCYGVMTNFSVSTNRSIVMMTVLLLSGIFGKTYDMISATSLSAFLILLQNPLQIMSSGFLLSFGAVIGIAVLLPCFQTLFPSKKSINITILVSISAQIATLPFVLLFYYQFPLHSIVINLIILPCITLLMLTSLVAGFAGVFYLPLGVFIIGGANYILKFYEWVCRIGSSTPGTMLTIGKPNLLQLVVYGSLIVMFIWSTSRYKKKYSILLLIIATALLMMPKRNVGLEITMLDVGQGDGIFLESESGTTYLVDGGSTDVKSVGKYRLQPFLLSQGVDHLDYMIMTHSDYDHISGLRDLIEENKIKIFNLILPQIKEKEEAYLEMVDLAKKFGIAVQYITTGDSIKDGEMLITCLHPIKDFISSSINAYSMVLSLSYGKFDMLLTGDLEKEGEQGVTKLLKDQLISEDYENNLKFSTDYDVLKVAHHGSKNSTLEEFLHIVKPEYSLISCGKNNRYGHPHDELLKRLSDLGSIIETTKERGAITIKTDGQKMALYFYKKLDNER